MKNKRINVRANDDMINKLKTIRMYLEIENNTKYSDSEIVEILLNHCYQVGALEKIKVKISHSKN